VCCSAPYLMNGPPFHQIAVCPPNPTVLAILGRQPAQGTRGSDVADGYHEHPIDVRAVDCEVVDLTDVRSDASAFSTRMRTPASKQNHASTETPGLYLYSREGGDNSPMKLPAP